MRAKLGENRKCLICQKGFYVKRVHILQGKGKYCSVKCAGQSRKGIIPSNLEYARINSPIKKGNNLARLNTDEKHWNWKADRVGYFGVHDWLKRHYGNATKCDNDKCIYPRKNKRGYIMLKPKAYQWANISGQYKRDIKDFMQLCSSCHKLYDLGKI